MNSFSYSRHLVARLKAELSRLNISPSEGAAMFGLSLSRHCEILGSEGGRVTLKTRQRFQEFLNMTWAAANAAPVVEESPALPEVPTVGRWAQFYKRVNRFRAFLFSLREMLGIA